MYIATVPNRSSPPAILLRESYREDGKVKTRTLANLSALPSEAVEAVRRVLSGEALLAPHEAFEIVESKHHGAVDAVLSAMRGLKMESLLSSRRCRERDLVMAMIAGRILAAGSKLKLTRWWETTSLPATLGVLDATEDDLYSAMDWLLERQPEIEKKLAARHLEPCALVLYDLTSTWFEGTQCPLAKRGYSRDGKRDKLQVNFGLLTDGRGCPVAVSVYEGSTTDSKTVKDQIDHIRENFKIDLVVFVGDRGMVTQAHVDTFRREGGVEWISALKSPAIRKLREGGQLQLGLFDVRNLFETTSPEFPDERLIACRNPELAKRRAHTRESLLDATIRELNKIRAAIAAGRLEGRAKIGLRAGRVINKYKVAKHFKLSILDDSLTFKVDWKKVEAEASLDGIYVIRTSVPKESMSSEDAVRNYKRLSRVERAFRATKTVDLHVRPIYHRTEARVRAHILLCMLAYYVEWHMREAWAPLLFTDENPVGSPDGVAPAKRSAEAAAKVAAKTTDDGYPVHSFGSLLTKLSTIVRNRCRRLGAPASEPTFEIITTPDAHQARALKLISELRPTMA
jgi:hypothetical protein